MFKKGEDVLVQGWAKDLWIEDYDCYVCSGGTVVEDQKYNDRKVLVTIDKIDGEGNVCCRVRASKLSRFSNGPADIKIVVANGRVDSVFSNCRYITIDVLDFDTQDEDELDKLQQDFDEIYKEYKRVF